MAAKGAYTFGRARQERGACPKRGRVVNQLQQHGYQVKRRVVYSHERLISRRATLAELNWILARALVHQQLREIGRKQVVGYTQKLARLIET